MGVDLGRREYVIVGQGLAGTMLAWHLLWLGKRPLLLDRDEPDTCSRVAAGLVTPVTGKRIALSWRVEEFHPAAMAFLARVEEALGVRHFHPLSQARLFENDDERARFAVKKDLPAFRPWLSDPQPTPLVGDAFRTNAARDGFEMRGSGWLDTREWLAASAEHFRALGLRRTGDYPVGGFAPGPDGVSIPDGTLAETVIFCQGHEAAEHPLFRWIPWKSAKGEILTIAAPDLAERRIIHRGGWLLPLGDGVHYRAGSTYEWNTADSRPSQDARAAVETRVTALLRAPFTVTGHHAGIRPIIRESKALLGRHSVYPRMVFFNGLGSKGVLHGPLCAGMLASHLVLGTELDPELDLRKNS